MPIYSKRLGNITDTQFQKALDKFDLGTFDKAEKVPFGNFGQNVFVVSDKGSFVLRGVPHIPHQFEGEKFIVDLLHQKTKVPVPYPYLLDDSTDIFGWKYIIMPKLPGIQLADAEIQKTLSKEDKMSIAKTLAETLAEMHSLTWECSGAYNPASKTVKCYEDEFFQVVRRRILDLVGKSKGYNERTTESDEKWISKVFTDSDNAFEESFTSTIIMQDYRQGNTVAEKQRGAWKITGVFDLQEWYFGDAEADLSRTSSVYLASKDIDEFKKFIDTYFELRPPRAGFENRFLVYMILDRAIVWEWAQRNDNIWWDKNFTFKDWCDQFAVSW